MCAVPRCNMLYKLNLNSVHFIRLKYPKNQNCTFFNMHFIMSVFIVFILFLTFIGHVTSNSIVRSCLHFQDELCGLCWILLGAFWGTGGGLSGCLLGLQTGMYCSLIKISTVAA